MKGGGLGQLESKTCLTTIGMTTLPMVMTTGTEATKAKMLIAELSGMLFAR